MDSESYRLGNENLWAWLVELLSKKNRMAECQGQVLPPYHGPGLQQ